MARNIYYRDFTLCKAAALVLLIGLAVALGGVPHEARDMAETGPDMEQEARMMPATLLGFEALCDAAETSGIRL